MKRFKLTADNWADEKHIGVLPKSFETVQESLDFAKSIKCVHESYLIQREPDDEDIRVSMQEIADMVESGEDVKELDMF